MNTALVVGGTGIIGRGIVESLASKPDWTIITASRSGEPVPGAHEAVSVDLLDFDNAKKNLASKASKVTHLFYAAYLPQPSYAEEVEPNARLLSNSIGALEANNAPLKHVTLITGAKYYGVHLAPAPSPSHEEQRRFFGPSFYHAQEDYLRSRTDTTWTWTNLIPSHLTGYAVGNPMNLALAIGVYASLCRFAGAPLDFPGTEKSFNSLTHIVDAGQLGESATWAAQTETGGTFNIANGDPVRWCHLWPRIAEYFRLESGVARPIPLAQVMADQNTAWGDIARHKKLVSGNFEKLVNWNFLQFVFSIDFDIVLALNKIRQAGFVKHFDTFEGFRQRFEQYAYARVLPNAQ